MRSRQSVAISHPSWSTWEKARPRVVSSAPHSGVDVIAQLGSPKLDVRGFLLSLSLFPLMVKLEM